MKIIKKGGTAGILVLLWYHLFYFLEGFMDEAVKYYRRTYKLLDDLIYTFRNGYDKKEILKFYKNCFLDYNYNEEIFRSKRDGVMLTIMISLLGINKESIENTNKFFEYNNSVVALDYRNIIRINHAKELLKDTNNPISEIAENAGYSSASYFCDAFRKKVGVSPSEYRKKA